MLYDVARDMGLRLESRFVTLGGWAEDVCIGGTAGVGTGGGTTVDETAAGTTGVGMFTGDTLAGCTVCAS